MIVRPSKETFEAEDEIIGPEIKIGLKLEFDFLVEFDLNVGD